MSTVIIIMLIVAEVSLICAGIGVFSIQAILLGIFLSLAYFVFKKRQMKIIYHHFPWYLFIVLFIAVFFFFQPYQYMDGGWDPGNYINTGVHIAKTGTIVYQDEFLDETAGSVRSDGTGLKCPGLYIKDKDKGIVVPQFFYLYPVWIAIFYKLFGLKAVFYVNPLFALLSVILMFLIVKRLINQKYGAVAAVLLCLNVIQIWNARFSTSEILGQFLLLGGFYFWLDYLDGDCKESAFWAGVCFGEFLLVGITSVLIIPICAIYLLYRSKKKDIYFIIPFLLLSVHLTIQFFTYSSIYLESVLMFFRRREIYLAFALFLIFIAGIVAIRKYKVAFLKYLIIFLIAVLFGYGYFLRPHISSSIEALNLIELGQWLSVFGLYICVLGLITIIYREKKEGVLFIVFVGLIYGIFFIYNKKMFSRYPFALRRYIPAVIPLFVLSITYFLHFINSKWKKKGLVLSTLMVSLVIILPLYNCRNIIRAKDNCGWLEFWSLFNKQMDEDAVYISNNYRWARPLNDVFGKNVIVFTGFASIQGEKICRFAKELIEQERDVYYISDQPKGISSVIDFVEVYEGAYKGEYIEPSLTFPPQVKKQNLNLRLYKLAPEPLLEDKEYVIDIGSSEIGLIRGFDKARKFSGMEGTARWTFKRADMVIPWFSDDVGNTIIMEVCGMPKTAGSSLMSLYVNDVMISKDNRIDEKMKLYTFHVPKGLINSKNSKRVVLTIITNTWVPSNWDIKGYPSGLGVLVDCVIVKKGG